MENIPSTLEELIKEIEQKINRKLTESEEQLINVAYSFGNMKGHEEALLNNLGGMKC